MEQYELIDCLIDAFEKVGVRYFVTGSVASIFYGEPRLTNDVDVVADLREEHIPKLLVFFPFDDFYMSEDAAIEAIRLGGQFNIIHSTSGYKIDVIIRKNNEFDDSRFGRTRLANAGGKYDANFSSPEDVIIMKMKYYKEGEAEKHLRDITGILKASETALEMDYIEKWARNFGVLDIWETILRMVKR